MTVWPAAYVNDGGKVAGQGGLEICDEGVGLLVLGKQTSHSSGPSQMASRSSPAAVVLGVSGSLRPRTCGGRRPALRVAGVHSQVDVGEEGAFEELAFLRSRV